MKKYHSFFLSGITVVSLLALPGYAATTYTYSSFDEPLTSASSPQTFPMGVNASGQVVGSFKSIYNNASIGFFKSGSSYALVSFPGAIETSANGINDAGYIVGNYISSANALEYGFVEYGGKYMSVKFPGTTYGQMLYDINDSGQITGYYNDTSGYHSFVKNGNTYTAIVFPGAIGTFAQKINNAGQVVGYYEDYKFSYHGFIASPK